MTYVPNPVERLTKLKAILINRNYTATEKNVAAYLLACQNSKDGRCNPSYETIADAIDIDRRSAIRACKALEAACELEICHMPRIRGDGLSSNQFNFAFENAGKVNADDRSRAEYSAPPGDSDVTTPHRPRDAADTTLVTQESPSPVTLESPKQRKKNKERGTQTTLLHEFDDDWFENELWPQYPRKEGKVRGKVKCRATIEGIRPDGMTATEAEIMRGVMRYGESERARIGRGGDPSKTKMLEGWLADCRWTDEPQQLNTGHASTTSNAVWGAVEAMATRNKRAAG